ncbi:hypothetical protein ACFYS8_14425 [Kitasatospora sp. NPDC004615]|uniref:hypothetical protein n=1 Tax=Kitasatospora sp. NPDC004615 TaxID=3364017 RepID=UPI0036B3AB19
MEPTWGIEGWQPHWHRSASDLAEHEGARLRQLVGRTVTRAWGVWIVEKDEWFADLPVLLEIGGQRVAVCVNRLEDLSVTWDDPIDTTAGPTWWSDWTLQWRDDVHPALRDAVGRTVDAVGLTEYDVRPTDRSYRKVSPAWVLTGLALALGGTGLWIHNALDENGLATGLPPDDHEHRTTWLDLAP